jgi:hypothetical protein
MALKYVPAHVNETTERVDNLGGLLSAVMIGALIVAINFLPVSGEERLAIGLLVIALVGGILFFIRERRARPALYDLKIASRRTFWVAAIAGIIVFGSLMGAAFISQQYLQNVLGYSTVEAGAAILPAGVLMVLVAPRSAKLVGSHGSRATLLLGQAMLFLAFVGMLLLWDESTPYWQVAIPYAFFGIGIGLAGTPSSNSLTGSVPVTRVGMASGTADLQRDLGGALMTSIFGALLTAGYASAMSSAISESGKNITQSTQAQLQLSYASAENLAAKHPSNADAILAAAQQSFLDGDKWAYTAALAAVALGMALVWFFFPKKEEETALRASFQAEDTASAPEPAPGQAALGAAG